jgi:hypothetical protein
MIKAEESSSMYDFMEGDYQAPVATASAPREKLVREAGWQSAEEVNKRYRDSLPDHVKESMTVTQKDHSYYAFQRYIFMHPPRDNFEADVNSKHTRPVGEFDFQVERQRYVDFYRSMMN